MTQVHTAFIPLFPMKLFTFLFAASALQADVITRDFIDRVAIIESNFNHAAVGDNKKAYGAWQLHEAAFREGLDWHKITTKKKCLKLYII